MHDSHLDIIRRMAERTSAEWQRRFELAVLSDVRATVKGVQGRISCFNEEKTLVAKADNALARVNDIAENITSVLAVKPTTITRHFLAAFKGTLDNVEVSLSATNGKLGRVLSKASSENAVRAEVTKALLDVLGTANRAEAKLQHQLSQLCTAVRCGQIEVKLRSMIEKNRFAAEIYQPAFNSPALLQG